MYAHNFAYNFRDMGTSEYNLGLVLHSFSREKKIYLELGLYFLLLSGDSQIEIQIKLVYNKRVNI